MGEFLDSSNCREISHPNCEWDRSLGRGSRTLEIEGNYMALSFLTVTTAQAPDMWGPQTR